MPHHWLHCEIPGCWSNSLHSSRSVRKGNESQHCFFHQFFLYNQQHESSIQNIFHAYIKNFQCKTCQWCALLLYLIIKLIYCTLLVIKNDDCICFLFQVRNDFSKYRKNRLLCCQRCSSLAQSTNIFLFLCKLLVLLAIPKGNMLEVQNNHRNKNL